ncbi:MAG: acyltransferase [Patescibacteria group bacterium]|jgi:maltose O-acetyltransferase
MNRKFFEIFKKFMIKERTIVWRSLFGKLGKGSRVTGRIKVYFPENIFVGEKTTLNEGVILNARTKLIIGDYCHISPGVIINTGSLDINIHYKKRPHTKAEVKIGDGVWLCSGALVNPGVTIGEGAVIASGSVVNHDVDPFTVVGGVPAKFIKKLEH